jgi:hypothetical protein
MILICLGILAFFGPVSASMTLTAAGTGSRVTAAEETLLPRNVREAENTGNHWSDALLREKKIFVAKSRSADKDCVDCIKNTKGEKTETTHAEAMAALHRQLKNRGNNIPGKATGILSMIKWSNQGETIDKANGKKAKFTQFEVKTVGTKTSKTNLEVFRSAKPIASSPNDSFRSLPLELSTAVKAKSIRDIVSTLNSSRPGSSKRANSRSQKKDLDAPDRTKQEHTHVSPYRDIGDSAALDGVSCRCQYPGETYYPAGTVALDTRSTAVGSSVIGGMTSSKGSKNSRGTSDRSSKGKGTTHKFSAHRGLKGSKSNRKGSSSSSSSSSTISSDSNKNNSPGADALDASTFTVAGGFTILPPTHPACRNVRFICPNEVVSGPLWSYDCSAGGVSPGTQFNGGVINNKSRNSGGKGLVQVNRKNGGSKHAGNTDGHRGLKKLEASNVDRASSSRNDDHMPSMNSMDMNASNDASYERAPRGYRNVGLTGSGMRSKSKVSSGSTVVGSTAGKGVTHGVAAKSLPNDGGSALDSGTGSIVILPAGHDQCTSKRDTSRDTDCEPVGSSGSSVPDSPVPAPAPSITGAFNPDNSKQTGEDFTFDGTAIKQGNNGKDSFDFGTSFTSSKAKKSAFNLGTFGKGDKKDNGVNDLLSNGIMGSGGMGSSTPPNVSGSAEKCVPTSASHSRPKKWFRACSKGSTCGGDLQSDRKSQTKPSTITATFTFDADDRTI